MAFFFIFAYPLNIWLDEDTRFLISASAFILLCYVISMAVCAEKLFLHRSLLGKEGVL